jgi:hypothetical protein
MKKLMTELKSGQFNQATHEEMLSRLNGPLQDENVDPQSRPSGRAVRGLSESASLSMQESFALQKEKYEVCKDLVAGLTKLYKFKEFEIQFLQKRSQGEQQNPELGMLNEKYKTMKLEEKKLKERYAPPV